MVSTVAIGERLIGAGHPCFIIAEAGVNHNGDLALAKRLIDAACDAHADAVKFQTFKADHLATRSAPKARYQVRAVGQAESQVEMLRRLELSKAAHRVLMEHGRSRGLLVLSTPFDLESVELLASLNVPAFKIASGDLTHLPLLRRVAEQGRPMIVSTGMATLEEVRTAVQVIQQAGAPPLILLHCVSVYPAPVAGSNLRAMNTLADAFHVPIGYSDHTLGDDVALAAVALGACVVEKHLTMDRTLSGPDHAASAEPAEFAAMVRRIRAIEAALGDGRKIPTTDQHETAQVARKSLVAACDIASGCVLTEALIAMKRPGSGLSPAMLPQVVGRRARQPIAADTVLTMEMVDG